MSTLAPSARMELPAPLASPAVYRITVDEYEAMAEAGILRDPRVELLDGLLVKKVPQKPPHVWTVESIDVERQVEVYTDPAMTGYQSSQVLRLGDAITLEIDGVAVGRVAVADLLPPRP